MFAPEQTIFEELAPELRGARILDIGIGTGRTTAALEKLAGYYVGCDYSKAMIAHARGNFPKADLRVVDARDLSEFANEPFDAVVFSFNGIDNAGHADRLLILREMRRVLKPGGVLIMSTHNRAFKRRPAWSTSNLDLSWYPGRLVRGLVLYAYGIYNHLRLRGGEREEPDYAIVNDDGHHYTLLQYYIHPRDQVRQLLENGYNQAKVYALDGSPCSPDMVSAGDYMVYYTARRAEV